MKMKRILAFLGAALAFASCGPNKAPIVVDDNPESITSQHVQTDNTDEKTVTIGFANMSDSIEFCMNVKVGLEKECKSRGWDIISLDNSLDGQKAIQNTELLLQQKVDFVVMFNIDANTQPAISQMLKQSGTPAIAIDIYMPDFPFFGVDNAKAGAMGGQWLGDYAKNNWEREPDLFVIMDNPSGGRYAKDRSDACEEGFRKVFPNFPAEKLARVDAKSDITPAQEAMDAVLAAYPDAKYIAVTGINDQVCAGALAALELNRRNSSAIICSLGADSSFLNQLQDTKGEEAWSAAIAFAPELYGQSLVPLIEKAINGEAIPDLNVTQNFIVTKETIGKYYPEYAFD